MKTMTAVALVVGMIGGAGLAFARAAPVTGSSGGAACGPLLCTSQQICCPSGIFPQTYKCIPKNQTCGGSL